MNVEAAFESLLGREIVLDMSSAYVILGTLRGRDERHYLLEEADVHDLRDTSTTREIYVLDAKRHGINPNRRRVLVRIDEVVALSAMADVLE